MICFAGLENDEYTRKTDGYLPTAEVAFIDEIFKANSAILNALLTLLNERLFDNGNQRLEVPLLCLVSSLPALLPFTLLSDSCLLALPFSPALQPCPSPLSFTPAPQPCPLALQGLSALIQLCHSHLTQLCICLQPVLP